MQHRNTIMNFLISIPRSGQHLTQRILAHYCKNMNIEFSYCEYYGHCKKIPCACEPRRLFQKNHDFNLNIPIDPQNKYLILYRTNKTEQLESWFRFYSSKDNTFTSNQEYISKFVKFINEPYYRTQFTPKEYYLKFINKWILTKSENILSLEYNTFIKNPYFFVDVFKFFFSDVDHNKDENILDNFMNKELIHKKYQIDLELFKKYVS